MEAKAGGLSAVWPPLPAVAEERRWPRAEVGGAPVMGVTTQPRTQLGGRFHELSGRRRLLLPGGLYADVRSRRSEAGG